MQKCVRRVGVREGAGCKSVLYCEASNLRLQRSNTFKITARPLQQQEKHNFCEGDYWSCRKKLRVAKLQKHNCNSYNKQVLLWSKSYTLICMARTGIETIELTLATDACCCHSFGISISHFCACFFSRFQSILHPAFYLFPEPAGRRKSGAQIELNGKSSLLYSLVM